jgi:hypothetical protein
VTNNRLHSFVKRLFLRIIIPSRVMFDQGRIVAIRIAAVCDLPAGFVSRNRMLAPSADPSCVNAWAAISDLDLPIAIHMGTSTGEQLKDRIERFGGVYGVHLVDNRMGNAMRLLAQLIFGAVTQRFPGLRFVMVESGIGWTAGVPPHKPGSLSTPE